MNANKLLTALFLVLSISCTRGGTDSFVRVEDGFFTQGGKKISFIGTNFWYGAILASEGQGGDRARLARELDTLKALGITNLRILAGAEGPDGVPTRIEPTLVKAPGVYNDTLLAGLDYLLAEMAKRDMKAVLFLNNAWEWSGGFGQYLEWAGAGKALIPSISGYWPFMQQMSQFSTNKAAQELYFDHLHYMVTRTNSITGKAYRDDPTIFSWQIANEPRCFSSDPGVQDAFVQWVHEAAARIKADDPNHMVSTGSEGAWGCENSYGLCERLHASADIDYVTLHIWPYNWNWAPAPNPSDHVGAAVDSTNAYIDRHLELCGRLGKPAVLEEFGFPRDGMQLEWGTWGRDRYYGEVAKRVIESDEQGGRLAGMNFWAWGGYGKPAHEQWQRGDDYLGDPAQEAQGLNSVFLSDTSTIAVIKDAVSRLDAAYFAYPLVENDWMYTAADPKPLRVVVKAKQGKVKKAPVKLTLTTDKHEPYAEYELTARPGKGMDTLSFNPVLEPGFYIATLSIGDGVVERTFNIGCDPEKISSPQDKQPDFDAFWEQAKAELAKVRPNFRRTLVPGKSNDVRRTYLVEFESLGGAHIKGILTEPVAEGKYPVKVTYNGYNGNPWWPDPSASPELIEFTISTRYQCLSAQPGDPVNWIRSGLSDKDIYHYRGAYMDCVRAVEFVRTLPKADLDNVFAEGASQGGAFTFVTAALVPDAFCCIAPMVPFMSDFPDYFKVADWPGNEVLPQAREEGISDEDLYRTLSYFDVKNFTDKITCPVFMLFGLQDETCPPHTNFAGYNQVRSEKMWKGYPLSGHGIHLQEPDLSRQKNAFYEKYVRF